MNLRKVKSCAQVPNSLRGVGARLGFKWPGLTPGPRHRFRVPYRSCRVAFVDPWHLQASLRVREMMIWSQFCQAVCPGVSHVTSLVQLPRRQSSSNNLMGRFSQGLIQFLPGTGWEGLWKVCRARLLRQTAIHKHTHSRASQAQTPSPLKGLYFPTPHLPPLQSSRPVNRSQAPGAGGRG